MRSGMSDLLTSPVTVGLNPVKGALRVAPSVARYKYAATLATATTATSSGSLAWNPSWVNRGNLHIYPQLLPETSQSYDCGGTFLPATSAAVSLQAGCATRCRAATRRRAWSRRS